jgi:hypothetical protein
LGCRKQKKLGDDFYYRGTGPEPFVYCARKAEQDGFGGAAFVVKSEVDFEVAQPWPGASKIYHLTDAPGGGKYVTFTDPVDGFPMYLVYGQEPRSHVDTFPTLDFTFVSWSVILSMERADGPP